MSQPSEATSNSQGTKVCIKLSGGNVISTTVPANQPCPSGYAPAPPGYQGGTPPAIGNPYSPVNPSTGENNAAPVINAIGDAVVPGYKQITDAFNAISSHLLDPNMWKGVGLVGLAVLLGVGGLVLLGHKPISQTLDVVAPEKRAWTSTTSTARDEATGTKTVTKTSTAPRKSRTRKIVSHV